MSELPELTYFFSNLAYTAVITRQSDGLLSEDEAKEIIHRSDCHDDLVAACENYIRHCELHDSSDHPKANMFCTECPRYRKEIEAALAIVKVRK